MSWAALVAGACSGSTVTDPSRTNGGEPIGGQPAGGDSGPAGAGTDTGGSPAGVAGLPGIAGLGGGSGVGGSGVGGSGVGGSPPGLVGSRLGRACTKDPDCQTANETGLKCISETSTVLGNGAPPRGLCTRPCATDDECAVHGAGAVCYPFGASADGNSTARYCLEGCQFGAPEIGESKCHSRPELACSPALLAPTGDPCSTSGDCAADELCAEGTCNVVFPACLPSCRGDLDCAAGMYCDQSFSNGLCRTTKPTGKRLGEPCTVPATNQPAEPDGCLGFCQADSDVGTKGHCAATCGLAHECAWDAASQRFDGICFYASVLTAEVGAEGDFGFCTPSCNCSEQCNDPALGCQLLDQGALDEGFKGPGLCFATDAASTPYEECASGGAGAGGASAGAVSSAGFGGAP